MKKSLIIFSLCFLLLIGFVSGFSLSDFFGKFTGKVVDYSNQPYCSGIGTRSEHWRNSERFIKYDSCGNCEAVCKLARDKIVEGWYSSCDEGLILEEECDCADTCLNLGYECGVQNVCGENISCGTCDSGYNCVNGRCEECIPITCDSLGYECGEISDRCGGTLSCGSCITGYNCVSGRCEEVEEEITCVDSDGGLDYYTKGNVTGISLSGNYLIIEDGCIIEGDHEGWLREAICQENIPTWQDYDCLNGCENGICEKIISSSCFSGEAIKKDDIFKLEEGYANGFSTLVKYEGADKIIDVNPRARFKVNYGEEDEYIEEVSINSDGSFFLAVQGIIFNFVDITSSLNDDFDITFRCNSNSDCCEGLVCENWEGGSNTCVSVSNRKSLETQQRGEITSEACYSGEAIRIKKYFWLDDPSWRHPYLVQYKEANKVTDQNPKVTFFIDPLEGDVYYQDVTLSSQGSFFLAVQGIIFNFVNLTSASNDDFDITFECGSDSDCCLGFECHSGICSGKESILSNPVCSRIGTRSEGWYSSEGFIKYDNCENCEAVCKRKGWYSSCDESLIQLADCSGTGTRSVEEETECDGCSLNGRCYQLGYRRQGQFCSERGIFVEQSAGENSCENNFECESNVCVNGNCISGSLIQRMLNWFRRIFGGE